jgi:hypothetical protein
MMVEVAVAVALATSFLHRYPDLDHPLSPEPNQALRLIASGPLNLQQDLPPASAA